MDDGVIRESPFQFRQDRLATKERTPQKSILLKSGSIALQITVDQFGSPVSMQSPEELSLICPGRQFLKVGPQGDPLNSPGPAVENLSITQPIKANHSTVDVDSPSICLRRNRQLLIEAGIILRDNTRPISKEQKKLGPSTCRFCRKCISVNALRTDVCFEGACGPSMGLRRTGLGLRSLWRLCLRGTAKEFVRLRCVRRRCGQACRGVRCGLRSTCGQGHIITSS